MQTYTSHSDTDLLIAVKSGDRAAFATIYDRYKFLLHHHAWNKTHNLADTEDALQEVFSNLWSRRESLEPDMNLAGYLYTAIRNYLLNIVAREDVRDRYMASLRSAAEVNTDHQARTNIFKNLIEKEIEALPPKMRQVFELSRKQHLSHREIAQIMGTSEQTVKKQMANALKFLRSRLGIWYYILIFFI